MSDSITIHVQTPDDDRPYAVVVEKHRGFVSTSCTCSGAKPGQDCVHIQTVLDGNTDALADPAESELLHTAQSWLQQSGHRASLRQFVKEQERQYLDSVINSSDNNKE